VLNGTFTVPGDGSIDYTAALHVLRDAGYEGWLVVEAEQDPAVAPSYQYAKKGYETLSALVKSLA
jgi:inosose dehydratase